MKALILTTENIEIQDIKKPIPKENEVCIKVMYASLNRRDQWARVGLYPGMTYGCVLGSDACGVVEQVGTNISSDWIDKEVLINPNQNWGDNFRHPQKNYTILGMPTNGVFAEYVCVPADRIHLKPTYLKAEEAAAIPLAALTAFRACFFKGNIQAGDKVLVTGIGGGVAQFVAQFAKAAGAEVWVSSGNDEKIALMQSKGLIRGGVNYKVKDWQKQLLEQSDGFDVVIDSAGGDDFNLLLRTLKPSGTLVFYGATLGSVKLDMPRVFFGQYTIKGTTMGNDEEFAEMLHFIEKYQIRPVINSVRSFDDIISAFDDMRDGKIFGKVVISL
ncbi:MAG: zinc-binding dehydrogenase [Thermonemataceae bacterium]|nr:zinc-binding dehydrogenase [Thermonemataceae bacterium]